MIIVITQQHHVLQHPKNNVQLCQPSWNTLVRIIEEKTSWEHALEMPITRRKLQLYMIEAYSIQLVQIGESPHSATSQPLRLSICVILINIQVSIVQYGFEHKCVTQIHNFIHVFDN